MTVYEASTWVIPVIIAITFHEAAHLFVALLFGDGTAWRLGRVSFNPLRHIDSRVASLAAFAVPFRLRQAGSG